MGSKVSWLIVFSLLCLLCAAGQEKSEGLEIKLLVNQAGYDLLSPKRVLLQTNFPPDSITEYEVVNNDRVHCLGKWGKPQKIEAWELWYREALLPISAPGRFLVRIQGPEKKVDSPPFAVQKDRLFEHTAPLATHFFYAQRCGVEVPGWHAACHLDDGCLPDGSHLDLVGGWHDGGDYNKYNGYTPLAVYALARLAQSPGLPVAFWGKSVPTPEEEALWGARWLIKCQDEKTGKIIGRVFSGFEYWGPPEFETDNWPGNADDRKVDVFEWNENEMTVAAWASVYQISGDPFWMKRALNLWEVVSAQRSAHSLVQGAKRLIAAAELYRITGDLQFSEAGQKEAIFLLSGQEADGSWPLWPLAIVDYGLPTAALAQFLLAFPPNPLSPSVQTSLVRAVESWSSKMVKPFFIPKWSSADIFYPFQPKEWYVGQNSLYLSQAWAGLLVSKAIPGEAHRLQTWAAGCLDWVLGVNPFGICMLEGAGSVHLKKYHHRYNQVPNGKDGRIPGAIPNGITRLSPDVDRPYLDLEGSAWQTNEPWLPHNAYFLLVLSEWPHREDRRPISSFYGRK